MPINHYLITYIKVFFMKEVIAVYINKEFKQFIMKSEVRLLLDIMKDNKNIVGIELVKISIQRYNAEFGK